MVLNGTPWNYFPYFTGLKKALHSMEYWRSVKYNIDAEKFDGGLCGQSNKNKLIICGLTVFLWWSAAASVFSKCPHVKLRTASVLFQLLHTVPCTVYITGLTQHVIKREGGLAN